MAATRSSSKKNSATNPPPIKCRVIRSLSGHSKPTATVTTKPAIKKPTKATKPSKPTTTTTTTTTTKPTKPSPTPRSPRTTLSQTAAQAAALASKKPNIPDYIDGFYIGTILAGALHYRNKIQELREELEADRHQIFRRAAKPIREAEKMMDEMFWRPHEFRLG